MTRATHYSVAIVAHEDTQTHSWFSRGVWLAVWIAARVACGAEPGTNSPVPHLQENFVAAQSAYAANSNQVDVAWKFARACFDRAEFPSNSTQRAELARLGIEAACVALENDSNSAAAHYYLAMNYGQLARTKMLGALPLVDKMEAEFTRARELDETFDHAGPDRNLGRLYFEAPAIASIGSQSKAREHFDRAAELEPDYPENQLNLIEAAIRWKELDDAHRELEQFEQKLEAARARFKGIEWTAAWLDWNARLEKFKAALRKPERPPARAGRGASLFN